MKFSLLALSMLLATFTHSQSFISYYTGADDDIVTDPLGGTCMMGGASENDEAMKWFLERANGGDILVLRASGSDGYNNYMYSELGVEINSVESIVCLNEDCATESYIHDRINEAEGIWFAGGDQWNYVNFWRDTAIDSLINLGLAERNIVIGGTSAGMAILGGYYFSAQYGTVTSSEALDNPYDLNVSVDGSPFLNIDHLANVITDTHYDSPDRKGRHVTFLARILTDDGIEGRGIACDEYTAVCVDPDGMATVYGEYPDYEDTAYFIQTNCELEDVTPETCTTGQPLNWSLGGQALKDYKAFGTMSGDATFDLNDWQTGVGGEWQDWWVETGEFMEGAGAAINCTPDNIVSADNQLQNIYPNPFSDQLTIARESGTEETLRVFNSCGQEVHASLLQNVQSTVDLSDLTPGLYTIVLGQGATRVQVVKD